MVFKCPKGAWVSLFICCIFACIYISKVNYTSVFSLTLSNYSLLGYQRPIDIFQREKHKCLNVLSSMVNGNWLTRNLTDTEKKDIDLFLLKARNGHSLPTTLQRPDGKCGNVTFDWLKSKLHPLLWFRALCDPKGDKPCCYNGYCVAASEKQCQCVECYDMRQQLHAEYSKWIPTKSECHLKKFTHKEACQLLNGSSFYFIGDSFARHIYTALLLILRNDFQHGAMKSQASPNLKAECKGMYMFTEKMCRMWLDPNVLVCNGTVRASFMGQLSSAYGPNFPNLSHKLSKVNKSMLITGIGIHENYNPSSTMLKFLKPLLTYLYQTQQIWPKVLWAGPHAPGLLKTPRIPEQNYNSVLKYNKVVNKYLESWGIPVLDTFNLTDGVMSFDGAHYGIGVNTVKAQIFLNYIQELTGKGLW